MFDGRTVYCKLLFSRFFLERNAMSHHSMSGVSTSGGGGKWTCIRRAQGSLHESKRVPHTTSTVNHGDDTYAVHHSAAGGEGHLVCINGLVHPWCGING